MTYWSIVSPCRRRTSSVCQGACSRSLLFPIPSIVHVCDCCHKNEKCSELVYSLRWRPVLTFDMYAGETPDHIVECMANFVEFDWMPQLFPRRSCGTAAPGTSSNVHLIGICRGGALGPCCWCCSGDWTYADTGTVANATAEGRSAVVRYGGGR